MLIPISRFQMPYKFQFYKRDLDFCSVLPPNRIMLQDNLRSAVFRSLTNESGTTRKSKTCNEVNNTAIQEVGHQGFREEERVMEFRERSELQLLDVSRGARELTRMTNYLSMAPDQSIYVGKELQRGALDLQESLVMLSKLQEASRRMARLKLKQKLRFEEEDIGFEETVNSRRVGWQEARLSFDGPARNCEEELMEMSHWKQRHKLDFIEEEIGVKNTMDSNRERFEKHRHSVDGSSTNTIEDLKRVIKDSLYKQNFLVGSSDDERTSSRQSLKSSRRSTQVNRFQDLNYEGKESLSSFVAATPPPKKAKGSNLIARLMGLEQAPFEDVQHVKKEEEKKRGLHHSKPSFDIERPKARKLQSVEEKKTKPRSRKKTLQEIIETMHLKGLLKRTQVDEFGNRSHCFDESQLEEYSRSFSMDDEVLPIVIMKPLCAPNGEKGFLLDKFSVKEEKASERKEVKTTEKAKVEVSQKITKTPDTLSHKLQRQKSFKKLEKIDEGPKPVLNGKKEEEKKDVKAIRQPVSRSKTASITTSKPDKKPSKAKSNLPLAKSAAQNSSSPMSKKKTSSAKSARKSTTVKTNDKQCEDGKSNNPVAKTKTLSKKSSTLPADEVPQKTEKEDKSCSKDDILNDQKILCEVMPKTSKSTESTESAEESIKLPNHKASNELAEEAIKLHNHKASSAKPCGVEDDLKFLLLSSQSFLADVQKLFKIDSQQLEYYQINDIEEDVTRNAKLYVDCGKELVARKSHHHECSMQSVLKTQIYDHIVPLSFDHLLEEISNGIKILKSYNKIDDDVTSEDSLYVSLERDLRCKETLVNAIWDIGWADCARCEDRGEVAGEVEEIIFSWLIEEVARDLLY